MKEFWKYWKTKTELETSAIEAIKFGYKLIRDNIPKENIVSIYVGGSFVMREMDEKSDVDIALIVSDSKLVSRVRTLAKRWRNLTKPDLCISCRSLWELNTGKTIKTKSPRMGTKRALNMIKNYSLIYGRKLDFSQFPQLSIQKEFILELEAVTNFFLKWFKEGKIGFRDLCKRVIWLARAELQMKSVKVPYSYEGTVKLVPKTHIATLALRHIKNKTKNQNLRTEFLVKLKSYLKQLTSEFA